MRFRLTHTALAEIDEICAYIEKDNPSAAAKSVAKQPNLAPMVHNGKVRAKLVERFQYRVFYEVVGQVVIIRNVRSTRRLRPWESQ